MTYDFKPLSAYDFEKLVRDLLTRRLGVPLEIFAPGPDQGIDLRHMSPHGHDFVIQCKHVSYQ